MTRIGLIVNRSKNMSMETAQGLILALQEKGAQVVVTKEVVDELREKGDCTAMDNCRVTADEDEMIGESDIIICLGGDGTFLNAARKVYKLGIPLLGINLGTLGFLTEIERHDVVMAVEKLMAGNYDIEERMMLEATVSKDGVIIGSDVALNDVVISRYALSRIIHLNIYMNNVFVDTFPGDGIIISSPTGSTGYSLSAGGPIVEPDVDLIIATPICPHILYSRTFITTGDRVVKIEVGENYNYEAMVTLDGQKGFKASGGYTIEVKRSPHKVRMIKISDRNFFNVLRTKFYDRGESLGI